MNITGRVQVKHYGPDGELLAVREYRNLIVNEGLNLAARLLDGEALPLNAIFLSEKQTAPNPGDTWANANPGIGGEGTATVSDNEITVEADLGPYSAPQPTYYSLLLAYYGPSVQTLFARVYIGPTNMGGDDSLHVTWTVTVS